MEFRIFTKETELGVRLTVLKKAAGDERKYMWLTYAADSTPGGEAAQKERAISSASYGVHGMVPIRQLCFERLRQPGNSKVGEKGFVNCSPQASRWEGGVGDVFLIQRSSKRFIRDDEFSMNSLTL